MDQKGSVVVIILVVVAIILAAGFWYFRMKPKVNAFGQAPSQFEGSIGKETTVQGMAIDTSSGAAVQFDTTNAGYRVYVEGLRTWPDGYVNKEVIVNGVLSDITDTDSQVPGAYTYQISNGSYSTTASILLNGQ